MIVFPPNDAVNKLILDRAMLFAGDDEADLYAPWLDMPGVYAVPEENIYDPRNNGAVDRLRRACAVYPDSTWAAVAMLGRNEKLLYPIILTDPAEDFNEHIDSRGSINAMYRMYGGMSILLFSMEYPAVVLFSVFEISLVTGSEEFVRAYFDDRLTEALKAFHDEWADFVAMFERRGSEPEYKMRLLYQDVCDQIRLPPGVTIPDGFEVL